MQRRGRSRQAFGGALSKVLGKPKEGAVFEGALGVILGKPKRGKGGRIPGI